jgi:thiamine-monophosphate kinase
MAGVASSGEFARIATYFAPLAAGYPGAFGLGDDAAVVAPSAGAELVVTTDTIVAGIHYIGDESPDLIAQKLLRVNLSDLAAMGASPCAYILNMALPPAFDDAWVAAFAAGLAADQDRYGIVLIGGDSVATPGPATLSVTGLGEVPIGRALRRNGARPGDVVFVSGTIGDAALGLLAARDGVALSGAAALIDRYQLPRPRLALGRHLRGLVHAATDISDGLVADLGHIASQSGVAARIDAGAVPLSDAARAALGVAPNLIETILTGGDDYELVFTAPRSIAPRLAALASEIDVPITAIGAIHDGEKVAVFDADGASIRLSRSGYTHG